MTSHPAPARALPLVTALTGGALLAPTLQILLSTRGLQVTDILQGTIAGNPLSLRAALVWWIIAGSALVAGAVIARPLAKFAPPWRRNRALRWILGALIVFGLAHAGHSANFPEGVGLLVYLITSTAAVVIASVMAVIGAIFAMRA